jgi:8-oxo-dGTP pyrophosphatase MutT (NUDIX family)
VSQVIGEKVIAYITQGEKLLVFSHPFHPAAGIQVPGGTLTEGESPHEAVMREAWEETGLDSLRIRSFLGVRDYDLSAYGRAGVLRCYFYH